MWKSAKKMHSQSGGRDSLAPTDPSVPSSRLVDMSILINRETYLNPSIATSLRRVYLKMLHLGKFLKTLQRDPITAFTITAEHYGLVISVCYGGHWFKMSKANPRPKDFGNEFEGIPNRLRFRVFMCIFPPYKIRSLRPNL